MRRSIRTVLVAATLAGCASAPAPAPAPVAIVPLQCPAVLPAPLCPAVTLEPEPAKPPEPELPRGRLQKSDWSALPEWDRDDLVAALDAFAQGCPILARDAAWQALCGRTLDAQMRRAPRDAAAFFQDGFEPWQVINGDETTTGLVTGYYEPLLFGSRSPTPRYRYPLYSAPADLLTIDLTSLYPELKHKRLRGRIDGNKVVPYMSRADIDGDAAPLKGHELVWVEDPVDLFFLHIQGSGQVQFEDGTRMRVGYSDQNGHPFRSLGGLLIRRGEIKPERASMQGIKDWARRNPARLQSFMNANPSYVFFKELPGDLTGPIGTLGVPLTAERSIAVDPRVIPLGVPVFLATTYPNSTQPLNRLMVAQDTGGAISGGVRADFYWGFGDEAGRQAGRMKQSGRMWVLLPRGYDPNATVPKAN